MDDIDNSPLIQRLMDEMAARNYSHRPYTAGLNSPPGLKEPKGAITFISSVEGWSEYAAALLGKPALLHLEPQNPHGPMMHIPATVPMSYGLDGMPMRTIPQIIWRSVPLDQFIKDIDKYLPPPDSNDDDGPPRRRRQPLREKIRDYWDNLVNGARPVP